ncbi:MAG TPA: HNH endonuclease [Stackebrandtia sp.]|nr:HNH endonuclease [Stackebrandtia sp.]HZE38548.1 HNH endonuclease [Stackebrandtia sp.]
MTASGTHAASGSMTTNALVLNATYEPLCVVSVRRAAVLLLSEKAETVTPGDGFLHSAQAIIQIPSVVRLNRYVKVTRRRGVSLTRRAVFARDGWKCAYCGGPAETIDHVMPRSRGGGHIWENVVASCARCNHKKSDRTPGEMGWRLASAPKAPKNPLWRVLGHRTPDPRWAMWLIAA